MRPSPPEAPARDDVDATHPDALTVEAPTAEKAIAQVHERLGPDAEIVAADRVLRGGLWGFFPKQVVQLTARPVTGGADAPATGERPTPAEDGQPAASTEVSEPRPEPRRPAPPVAGGDIGSVLARLSAEQDNAEEGLGEALRRHLGVTIDGEVASPRVPDPQPATTAMSSTSGWAPPAIDTDAPRVSPAPDTVPDAANSLLADLAAGANPTAPATRPTAPVASPATPATPEPTPPADSLPVTIDDVEWDGPEGAPWSGRGLLMLGLPRGFVDAVLAQAPADDAAWTYAVACVLAPLCRPMPAGEAVVIGPRAQTFGRALGVPSVKLSEVPRGTATFAVACTDSARARTWLAENRRHRWTHLVVSGLDWRGLLFEDPLAVSWVGDDTLGEAIRVAYDLGMVLGAGVRSETSDELVQPVPIELAMLLRDMLGGRR